MTSQRLGISFNFTLAKVQKNLNLQEAAATQSFLKQTNKKKNKPLTKIVPVKTVKCLKELVGLIKKGRTRSLSSVPKNKKHFG